MVLGERRPDTAHAETTTNGEIAIGRSVYETFGLPGMPANWMKQSITHDEGELGLGAPSNPCLGAPRSGSTTKGGSCRFA